MSWSWQDDGVVVLALVGTRGCCRTGGCDDRSGRCRRYGIILIVIRPRIDEREQQPDTCDDPNYYQGPDQRLDPTGRALSSVTISSDPPLTSS